MDSVTLGLLLPSSTIFPIGKEFEKGLRKGLENSGNASIVVEIVKEFVYQGGTKQVEDSLNKFFTYDDVDLVAGIISERVTESLSEKFLARKKPFLVSNLGGYVPDLSKLNKYIYINSFHLWQHAWALGNWGVKTFGKKGMYVSAVYDAGYSYSQMFHAGMMDADPQSEWSFSVLPMPAKGALSNMEHIFPFLEQYQPDFVFATFCGAETTLFLNEFIKRGWHKRTHLLGLPFLLDPFEPLIDDLEVYTTISDINTPELDSRKCFYQLGLQTGTIIASALASDGGSINDRFAIMDQKFSNGEANFLKQNTGVEKVAVVKNFIKANSRIIGRNGIVEIPAFSLKDERLGDFTKDQLMVSWMNPYLCI